MIRPMNIKNRQLTRNGREQTAGNETSQMIIPLFSFGPDGPAGRPLIWFAKRDSASDIARQASDQSTLF
jgi:hypothetical protein